MNCTLATGDWGSDLEYHSAKVPSSTPVNFASTGGVGAQNEGWLVQVHAVFMVLAWMAAAASGILIAR